MCLFSADNWKMSSVKTKVERERNSQDPGRGSATKKGTQDQLKENLHTTALKQV